MPSKPAREIQSGDTVDGLNRKNVVVTDVQHENGVVRIRHYGTPKNAEPDCFAANEPVTVH